MIIKPIINEQNINDIYKSLFKNNLLLSIIDLAITTNIKPEKKLVKLIKRRVKRDKHLIIKQEKINYLK